jgi:hypothetical protein
LTSVEATPLGRFEKKTLNKKQREHEQTKSPTWISFTFIIPIFISATLTENIGTREKTAATYRRATSDYRHAMTFFNRCCVLRRRLFSSLAQATNYRIGSLLHELDAHNVLNDVTALNDAPPPSASTNGASTTTTTTTTTTKQCVVSESLREPASTTTAFAAARRLPGVYVGIDPTASSLHIGNLLQLCTLMRFKRRGFPTYVVIGGGTGLIGDPSGRNTERPLVDDARMLQSNIAEISTLVDRIMNDNFAHSATPTASSSARKSAGDDGGNVSFPPLADAVRTTIVDNASWLGPLKALDFLRDVGKHFAVSVMLAKDSVKSRLHADNAASQSSSAEYVVCMLLLLWRNSLNIVAFL